MSFTNTMKAFERSRTVVESDLDVPHEDFRCYLCGHKFVLGDQWRWVYDNDGKNPYPMGNFIVCGTCDGPDVRERWWKLCQDYERIWAWRDG